jgi:hypothetical protein
MMATANRTPWTHWIADNFLSAECLAEVKSVRHAVPQLVPGKRADSVRLFIDQSQATQYPHLHALWQSLHSGKYKDFLDRKSTRLNSSHPEFE